MHEWMEGDINLSLQQRCHRGSPWEWQWAGVSWWWRLPPRERCIRSLRWKSCQETLGYRCVWSCLWASESRVILLVYLLALILNKHPRAPVERLKSLPVRGAEARLDPYASGHIHNQSVVSSQGSGHWGSCRMSGSICVILISPNLAGAYFPPNDLMLWGDSFGGKCLGLRGTGKARNTSASQKTRDGAGPG